MLMSVKLTNIIGKKNKWNVFLNPFLVNVPTLYHLKTPENLWNRLLWKTFEILKRNGFCLLNNPRRSHLPNIVAPFSCEKSMTGYIPGSSHIFEIFLLE